MLPLSLRGRATKKITFIAASLSKDNMVYLCLYEIHSPGSSEHLVLVFFNFNFTSQHDLEFVLQIINISTVCPRGPFLYGDLIYIKWTRLLGQTVNISLT